MFSVVVPLYNKAANIKQTLESVLDQTYTDFEIVVVNDGSSDDSPEIVRSINDPRIRLINQTNAGVSAARNKGIAEAQNDWIAFLDADDLWKPNKLEEVAKAINSSANITWLVTGMEIVKGKQIKEFLYKKGGFLKDALDALLDGLYIQTSSVIVKKQLFNDDSNLLFRIGLNNSEDREVWYKLIFKYPKLFYINKILASYIRDTGNSLTITNNVNFGFLTLNERLKVQINNLEESRRKKFFTFINLFNRRAFYNFWLRNGTNSPFVEHLDVSDLNMMRILNPMPNYIKRIFIKLFVR